MNQYVQYGQRDRPDAHDGDNLFLAVNLRLSPDKLPPSILADSENSRIKSGEVEPRLGVQKPGWVNVTAALVDAGIRPVTKFYGSGVFKDPASLEWAILAADGFIYRCRENNARFAFGLPVGVNIYSDVTFCQAFNRLYCFRGRYLAPLVLLTIDSDWTDIVQQWSSAATYNAAVTVLGQLADEIAYGPYIAVTSITSVADKATVITSVAHGYVTGADVTITGANQASYNGRFNITVVDEATFTYQFTGNGTSPATGTIKCSNNSLYWKSLGSRVTLTALTITAVTSTSATATATKVAHGFTGGQYATIAGASPAAYNGTFQITVLTADTFTYTLAADPGPNTVLPTATTSLTLAGQSPDTNPEAWTRVYNVLPNADNAIFVNNRMLVPTAYTPGAQGADGYNSTATTYTKKDFIIALGIGDSVHFDFVNEFRINQGSDDEIVDIIKYDNDTLIVFKEKSWGIISNVRIDLSQVKLDMRPGHYGLCARGAAAVAGLDVYFVATGRGVVSLNQTQQGLLQSVDTPFSNDIEPWIRRINWGLKNLIRLTWWDNKLHVAVPMDDCTVGTAGSPIAPNSTNYGPGYVNYNGLTVGQYYTITPGANEGGTTATDGTQTLTLASGVPQNFKAGATTLTVIGPPLTPVTAIVQQAQVSKTNNAILIHDFRNLELVRALARKHIELGDDVQAWAGRDTGLAICPKEFILTSVGGRERLLFTAADGYVNLYEESMAGDEVANSARANKLGWAEIVHRVQTRGYTHQEIMPKKFPYLELGLSVWNAKFSLTASTGQSRSTQNLITDKEFSRTNYLRPFDRAPWTATNANGDFAAPHRGNYSVLASPTGIAPGASLTLAKYYDVFARWSTRTLTGGYVQFTLTNTQGRCTLKSIAPAAKEGPRRLGVIV